MLAESHLRRPVDDPRQVDDPRLGDVSNRAELEGKSQGLARTYFPGRMCASGPG